VLETGVRLPAGSGIYFLFTAKSRAALGPTQFPVLWVLWLKRPRLEADHSSSTGAENTNAWSYISTPQYVFIASCLCKHRVNFHFTVFILLYLHFPCLPYPSFVLFSVSSLLFSALLFYKSETTSNTVNQFTLDVYVLFMNISNGLS
jgi:hypothetical protein